MTEIRLQNGQSSESLTPLPETTAAEELAVQSEELIRKQVTSRNNFRREVGMALLDVEDEVAKLNVVANRRRFNEFARPLQQRVIDKLINIHRRKLKDAGWSPGGPLNSGYWISERTNKLLTRIYKWNK